MNHVFMCVWYETTVFIICEKYLPDSMLVKIKIYSHNNLNMRLTQYKLSKCSLNPKISKYASKTAILRFTNMINLFRLLKFFFSVVLNFELSINWQFKVLIVIIPEWTIEYYDCLWIMLHNMTYQLWQLPIGISGLWGFAFLIKL